MHSHLTPRVFRRLLSPQGLTFRCPSQTALVPRFYPRNASQNLLRAPARRSLWGFSSKPERQPRDPELDPGLSKMLDLRLMDKLQARPPPPKDLVTAWRKFFGYKKKTHSVTNNIQARHVLRTFLHLQKHNTEEEGFGLNKDDLRIARDALTHMPLDGVEEHNKLAWELYNELERREPTSDEQELNLHYLVRVLSLTGHSDEARDLTKELWESKSRWTKTWNRNNGRKLWRLVLSGFAKEGNESELLRTWQLAESSGMPYGWAVNRIITKFYAERDDVEGTKMWYNKPTDDNQWQYDAMHDLLAIILRFSIRNDELVWCKTVFRDVLQTNPNKKVWDVILQWAAGTMGKGVEDVERMMDVMSKRSTETRPTTPDIDTINGLVEMSMALRDPYLAERYIELGRKSGIPPNAKTFIMQMNYRAEKGDLTGAQLSYEALQSEEIIDDEDLPAINKYIRTLCAGKANNYDLIVSIISDLEERNARLEAQTTSALAMMYLHRDELVEAIDLLNTNVYHYTLSERNLVRETFTEFCFDPKNSTARVWDAYSIMRQIFDETDTETRTNMMKEFFRRGRCDMACHTFGHMRQHVHKEKRPVLETYIECFLGIASLSDRESLDMIHNMLKMDSSIEPSTKLYNSLMLAYTACEASDRALDFWDDITNSNEGPSYRSLEIAFNACQRKPFGDRRAREIWGKMRRMEIEVTRGVFVGFLGALAGQGNLDEGKRLVEGMEGEMGLKVDSFTLGMFYNAIPGQNRKDLVEEWAKSLYPEIWEELVKVGQTEQKEGHRLFNIKREILASVNV